ncbi:MAG: virion morphogenesis protein [Bacteroidetes bacterium 41-46]|nr:MAG: virion morphogenesis protein [Bacteroidetes bacterium 41-46]
MDIKEFDKQFASKMNKVQAFVQGEQIKDILGVEAVNHFKASFENEGFTDEEVKKWPDVKRRNPDSKWYGHSGQTGKFSQTRTLAKILSGESGELKNSISYVKIETGVRVTDATPYAGVHQFGEMAKVYGKKVFQMPARPFMGKSAVLKKKIEDKITAEIKKILK